jgi:hypothetical protein
MHNIQVNFTPGISSEIYQLRSEALDFRHRSHDAIAASLKKIIQSDELLSSADYSYKKLSAAEIVQVIENTPAKTNKNVSAQKPRKVEIKDSQKAVEISTVCDALKNSVTGDYQYEIDVNNIHEIRFWSKQLNVSRPEIIDAIEKTKSKCWKMIRDYFLNSSVNAIAHAPGNYGN